MTRGPSPANTVTVSTSAANPRLTASDVNGEPTSSSAKQKLSLPGFPCAARSTSPGRPPPMLRTINCTARPMVMLARLPCPNTLTPLFIPIARVPGPLQIKHRADRHRRGQHSVNVELVGAHRFEGGDHPRQVLGSAAGHHRVDGDFLDGHLDEVWGDNGDDLVGSAGGALQHLQHTFDGRGRDRADRRSRRGRTAPPSRRRDRPARACRERSTPPPNRARSESTRFGSTLSEPQPGRITGRSAPSSSRPVIRCQSDRSQPTVRSTSLPSTTRINVGTVSMSWCQLIDRSASCDRVRRPRGTSRRPGCRRWPRSRPATARSSCTSRSPA